MQATTEAQAKGNGEHATSSTFRWHVPRDETRRRGLLRGRQLSLLAATGPDPVGAAALLGHGDADELARFKRLEDAVWAGTSLAPSVIEAVRLRSAHIRGCEFCSAVRVSAAVEDGLSEERIGLLDSVEARAALGADTQAALALVDRFLRDPRRPPRREADGIAATLGTRGVLEVLLAVSVFATADLRIALGENREPAGSGVVERRRGQTAPRSASTSWPRLSSSPLAPGARMPEVAPALADEVAGLVLAMWSGTDVPPALLAACAVRGSQLHGVAADEAVRALLVPGHAPPHTDADAIRQWPETFSGFDRDVLRLAEQLWLDPAGVDASVTDPLLPVLGTEGVVRVAWDLIWVGQLQRLVLVVHRD